MAMRPAVGHRGIMLIVFAIAQWLFMRYILANNLFCLRPLMTVFCTLA